MVHENEALRARFEFMILVVNGTFMPDNFICDGQVLEV